MNSPDSSRLADKVEKIFTGDSLSNAAKYYGINKQRTIHTSINKSLIVGFSVGASIFLLHPILGCVLGIVSFLATLSVFLGSYPNRLVKERQRLERYGTLFLEGFSTTLASTESLLRAVISVCNQEIPGISPKFKRILKRIENGEDPERLICGFSNSLPSATLRMAINRIVDKERHGENISPEMVEATEREMRRSFANWTAQMESRITVIFAIDFFVPTLAMLSATMLGLAQSSLIFLLIPFHLCLIDLAQTKIAGWGIELL